MPVQGGIRNNWLVAHKSQPSNMCKDFSLMALKELIGSRWWNTSSWILKSFIIEPAVVLVSWGCCLPIL